MTEITIAQHKRLVRSKPLTESALQKLIRVEKSDTPGLYWIDLEHTAWFPELSHMNIPNRKVAHQIAEVIRQHVASMPVAKQHRFFEHWAWLDGTGIIPNGGVP